MSYDRVRDQVGDQVSSDELGEQLANNVSKTTTVGSNQRPKEVRSYIMGKVVDLQSRREPVEEESPMSTLDVFKEALEKYRANKKRLAKERAENNKKTLRSYRIK